MRYIIGKGTITAFFLNSANAKKKFATQFKNAKTQEFPQYLL